MKDIAPVRPGPCCCRGGSPVGRLALAAAWEARDPFDERSDHVVAVRLPLVAAAWASEVDAVPGPERCWDGWSVLAPVGEGLGDEHGVGAGVLPHVFRVWLPVVE